MSSPLTIPDVLTKEEGRKLLLQLENEAANRIKKSSQELSLGILALNKIREHGLFHYGGYSAWNAYLQDFIDQRAISRALAYDNLKVARLALDGMGFTETEFTEYGVYLLRPIVGKVDTYKRESGEIRALKPGLEERLPPAETPGKQLAAWTRSEVDPKTDTPKTVRQKLKQDLPHKTEYKFYREWDGDGNLVEIPWSAIHPDGKEEIGDGLRDMPYHVQEELMRRVKFSGED